MTERAIEDWLAKASERSYQTAFCQLLNAMGYSVVHSTTHGPAEEGKDVIAKDKKGKTYAFQLKRGNVNVSSWRVMKSEIEELVELPIRHPSVNSRMKHFPVLVTNGYINENVASRIDGMNNTWQRKRFRPLTTWAGSELLMHFLKHTKGFLPQPLKDFHRLLSFLTNSGIGPLDKAEFDLLLKSILPISEKQKCIKKNDVKRSITASAIIVEYALVRYDKMKNHFAKIEAYTMLFCYIRAAMVIHRLKEKDCRSTLNIIETAMDSCVESLFEESKLNKGFGQGDPFTEPIIAPYRNTLLAGVMAAHFMWDKLGGPSKWYRNSVNSVNKEVVKLNKNTKIPSEAFIPSGFLTSEFLRNNGHIKKGDKLFVDLLNISVLRKQGKLNVRPLWNPYLENDKAILKDLGKKQDSIFSDSWEYDTYTAWPLVLVATNRLLKQELQSIWSYISSLSFHEFVPTSAYKNLLWDNRKGDMVQRILPQPYSWRKLQQEAKSTASLPYYFKKYEHWLPYYFLVYPHRFTPAPVLALCDIMSGA